PRAVLRRNPLLGAACESVTLMLDAIHCTLNPGHDLLLWLLLQPPADAQPRPIIVAIVPALEPPCFTHGVKTTPHLLSTDLECTR
ncbi:MAG: hypothetical protein U0990_09920, partial [Candidatus Nanopelagicales bacterium]|nr:hypothetical protein [Candidatus Nanopelagicales bacterium]